MFFYRSKLLFSGFFNKVILQWVKIARIHIQRLGTKLCWQWFLSADITVPKSGVTLSGNVNSFHKSLCRHACFSAFTVLFLKIHGSRGFLFCVFRLAERKSRGPEWSMLFQTPSTLQGRNRPFYSYRFSDLASEWQRGWSWPNFGTDLTTFTVQIKLFLC